MWQMKFIAVLKDPKDVEYINLGISNEDITLARVSMVARAEYGIFAIDDEDKAPSANDLREAAQKLLKLADIREKIDNETNR
jgi:hypothetical protein